MTPDHQIGPVLCVILLAVFIRNETATCNCLIDVLSKWLFKTSDIEKRCLWENCVKPYMKNFATSPCYHVVITYVCLGACTLSLHFINSDLLFNRLFPLYELILSFSFRLKYHFLLLKLYGGCSLKMFQVTFGITLFLLIPKYG